MKLLTAFGGLHLIGIPGNSRWRECSILRAAVYDLDKLAFAGFRREKRTGGWPLIVTTSQFCLVSTTHIYKFIIRTSGRKLLLHVRREIYYIGSASVSPESTQNETLPCAWQPDDLQSWTRVFSAWKKPTEPRVWIRSQPIEPTGTPVPTQRASIKVPNGKGLCRVMATLQKPHAHHARTRWGYPLRLAGKEQLTTGGVDDTEKTALQHRRDEDGNEEEERTRRTGPAIYVSISWRARVRRDSRLSSWLDHGRGPRETRPPASRVESPSSLSYERKDTYKDATFMIGFVTKLILYRFLRIVDIPGDERLRGKYFDKYKSSVKGLVYIIDAVTIQKEIRDVAEYLYNLLSDPDIQKTAPVLIMCNKQDQTMAKGCYVIKALLEKEMNLLRMTKTSQLEATDASSTNIFLGKQGKHFEFSHLDSQIDFVESYASNDDSQMSADIEELKKWLIKIA
ncbi:Signal recognition particle receptor subunit beta [Atta colombica]|uniref:Signal recognition particle receptor subunit beta n=1 Tax=Atta colombica TaxID=520822 RepID=A0A195B2S0_9HYME|nr:Signal recognition particle receptor subunit beta [Atta colombica]